MMCRAVISRKNGRFKGFLKGKDKEEIKSKLSSLNSKDYGFTGRYFNLTDGFKYVNRFTIPKSLNTN